MTDYTIDAQNIADAMNSVYENKQVNKKNNISGDFSEDNVSYPTVKAVKNELGDYVTTTALNTALSSYTTTSALNALLSEKVNIIDIVNNLTSTDTNKPLSANQGKILNDAINTANTNLTVTISKQGTAETGYASTYVISQGGTALSPKINIPKDKMLRSISVETVGATPTQEEIDAGLTTGDKYILLVVNTEDNDGTTRLILPITDVFDLQKADESTLTLSSNGVFSIKASGVDTSQLKNESVTSDKIATTVKDTWLSVSDVQSEISDFATALAEAINPSE